MPKVQPPELKKLMDKRLSRKWLRAFPGQTLCLRGPRARARASVRPQNTVPPSPSPLTPPPLPKPNPPPSPPSPPTPTVVLNANRRVTGTLRGFDQFMNVVLDQGRDATRPDDGSDPHADLGGMVVVRGASIVTIEVLDPIA
jgi:small nuclear ribonucleoprotein G